ncbi:hypothetical protein D3C86_2065850 [compost metagenome]
MAKDVMCEVNSCKYWATGDKCNASSISIVSHHGKNQARNSEETDCHTFEPKA